MLVVSPLLTLPLLDASIEEAECLEYLNILDDDLVRETYRRFKMAGAQCAPTNTLGAHRAKLSAFGLEDALADINRAGVRILRELGFEHILATLEVGEPELLREQLAVLLCEAPDALMLVGRASDAALPTALAFIRSQTELPLIAAVTFEASGALAAAAAKTADAAEVDTAVAALAAAVAKAGIVALMGLSPTETLRVVRRLRPHCSQALMACPVPAVPDERGGQLGSHRPAAFERSERHSLTTPLPMNKRQRALASSRAADDLVDFALEARALGVQLIGTAPGSSPIYTGALFAAVGGQETLA
jgi:methionine synthase I (cobalamin-dependent)